jgi:Flp pilus assembly pilin Flp
VTAVLARLWRDIAGAAMVEYTLAFPLFALVALGTVDLSYMFVEWSMANKAAYIGARTAIVSDPVASNITSTSFLFTADHLASSIGEACLDSTGAAVNGSDNTSICPTTLSVTCTSASPSPSCTSGGIFSATAFNGIFDKMQAVFPRLQAANVSITYQINGAGFAGMPGGLPMNVTVSIVNMTHELFFAPGFLNFFGSPVPTAWPIPSFSSTLTSECMQTDLTDPPTC